MKSRPKRISPFLYAAVILVLISFLALDSYLSLKLNQELDKIKINLRDNLGLNLEFDSAYFDIFSGIFINGLKIKQDARDILDSKNIKLNLDILNLFLNKKLSCRSISITDAYVHKTDKTDKNFLSLLLSRIRESKDIMKSIRIRVRNLNIADLVNMDIDGYAVFAQSNLFLTRGKARINEGAFLKRVNASQNKNLYQNLNYTFESTFYDNDLVINRLDLTGYGAASLILSGRIKDFNNSFDMELSGELRNFLLDDVPLLNNSYFGINGVAEINFIITGPAAKPVYNLKAKIKDASLNILDSLRIKKVNSDLVWDSKSLYLHLSGLVDKSPLDLELNINNSQEHQIDSKLAFHNLGRFNKINMIFRGGFSNKVLAGDLDSIFDCRQQQRHTTTAINLRDINFNLTNSSFQCGVLDVLWNESDKEGSEKRSKHIEFKKAAFNLKISNSSLSVDNIDAGVYGGTLKGSLFFNFRENAQFYTSKIYLDGVQTDYLSQELLSIPHQLSGVLSGRVTINSGFKENISGDVRLAAGRIDNNEVLVAISDFFGISSLRAVDFSDLRVDFRKFWDRYSAEINLFSSDINVYLNSQFFQDKLIDGYLSVQLATKLMDESPRFRRLFKYIGYNEPTVTFPFKLKGYVDRPRIEWLQNEFKEKLQDFLSEGNKKLLQEELNKMVGELVNE